MARCPKCQAILPDEWVKSQGAALMGRSKGKAKARRSEIARAAAERRWSKKKIP